MTLSQEYQDKRKAYLDHEISHEDFYLWISSVVGWGWRTANMGKSVEWWAEKYQADEHLNNVPLKDFDAYYPLFQQAARGKGIWIAMADCVCTLKTIISRTVKDHLGLE